MVACCRPVHVCQMSCLDGVSFFWVKLKPTSPVGARQFKVDVLLDREMFHHLVSSDIQVLLSVAISYLLDLSIKWNGLT